MWSVSPALLLLCALAVLEAPHIPPGFVTCTHKFKAGHEWVGQINSNLCYKRLSAKSMFKKDAENGCKQYEKPDKPEDGPAGHLPLLKTQADRNAFLNLTFHTPCPPGPPICFYWIGIEMVSYVPNDPNQIYWEEQGPQPRGVAKFRWDDGEEEKDWERKDFIGWTAGFLTIWIPIADHKYVIEGGRTIGQKGAYKVPQSYYRISNKPIIFLHGRIYGALLLAFCQKVIDSPLTAPPTTSTTPTRPLPSKHTQPTTVRIYTRQTMFILQTRTSSHKSTRLQEIEPSSLEEEGLSSTLMYILAGGFGVLLVVAMLIAGVYGMHRKGKRRRHKRKGHKVNTNEDEPRTRSSTAHIDSSTTEHS